MVPLRNNWLRAVVGRSPISPDAWKQPGLSMLSKRVLGPAIALLVAFIHTCAATSADLSSEVLVYYANETPEHIIDTENYRRLFDILQYSGTDAALKALTQLKRDAELFHQIVTDEVSIILSSAKLHQIPAAIFTNTLARHERYIFYNIDKGAVEERAFPVLPMAADRILEDTPLARPEAL